MYDETTENDRESQRQAVDLLGAVLCYAECQLL